MALQSVYGWQPFLPGSKLSTRKTETSWNLLSISIFLFIFSRHSSTAKWLEQSAPPGQQKHNAVVSPKMRRGQCLGDGGDRHLRENLRNRFVLKKAAGSTHIIFSIFWFVSSLESACRRRCRFSSFNTKTADFFFFFLDFWSWFKFSSLLFFSIMFFLLTLILFHISYLGAWGTGGSVVHTGLLHGDTEGNESLCDCFTTRQPLVPAHQAASRLIPLQSHIRAKARF